MQELTSTHKDENDLPLLAFLNDDGLTVHMLSSVDNSEVFSVTYQDYLIMKQWINI